MDPRNQPNQERRELSADQPIHRVRNEGTEKEMSPTPWCGADLSTAEIGRLCTIHDGDVTCDVCIEIIGRRQIETGTVDLRSRADELLMHFPGHVEDTLCGLRFGVHGVAGLRIAGTLRDTTCPKCLDQAEETLTRAMAGVEGLSRKEIDEIELRVLLEGGVGALRDIAETLKECAAIWMEDFEIDLNKMKTQADSGPAPWPWTRPDPFVEWSPPVPALSFTGTKKE